MKAVLVNVNDIQATQVQWLWPGMIPLGKLVVMCGDPGLGKSFITLDLASRTSRGGPWPLAPIETCVPGKAGRVVLISAEDDPSDTIRPRLEQMGARLDMIDILDGMSESKDRIQDFVIGEHAADLRKLLDERPDIRLLVIDPVSAYVGATDSYNNAQVRSMLKPLSDLAADYGVAVILVTHICKSESAKSLHGAMGSLAFTAAARVVLLVAKDPRDPDTRMLMTVKSNLSCDRVGYSYRVEDGRVRWVAMLEGQADELMQPPQPKHGGGMESASARKRAALVAELLARIDAENGVEAKVVRAMCEQHGVSFGYLKKTEVRGEVGLDMQRRENKMYWVRR